MIYKSTNTQKAKLTPTSDKNPIKVPGNCPNSISEIEINFTSSANQNAISEKIYTSIKKYSF